MPAPSSHRKAPEILARRRGRRWLASTNVGTQPAVEAWLAEPVTGDATVTPAAIAVTAAVPTPAVSVGAAPAVVAATVAVPAPTAGQPPAGASITWLYSQSGGNTSEQTRTATSLAFQAGDRVLVVGYAMPNGHGDVYAMAVSDSASTNNPTWSTLVTGTTNTTSSSAFCTKLVAFISDPLTANETFDITIDWQTGSANDYFGTMGVARLVNVTSAAAVQTAQDIGSNFNDDDAVCTFGGAVTAGNLAVMVVAGREAGSFSYDSVPADFATISGAAVALDGFHLNAIDSTTATASSVAWGFESVGGDYNLCSLAFELEAGGGGGGGSATATPAVITATATVPQPAVSVAATPPAVAAVASMPTPTAQGGATRTPATIAAVATVPTPTALTGTVRTPAVIAAAVAVGDPDVSVGTAPATVAATATVPTPTAGQTGGGGATATPATVAATSTVPQPAVAVGAAPATVTATATVPTPTALTGARATPAAVAAVAAVPAPAVAVGAAPATVAAVAALPAPTVLTGTGAAPATISTTTTVPKPNVSVGAAPAPIAATVTMPAPSIVVVFTVAPATVLLAVTVPAPRVAVGAAPATVAVVVAIGTPTIPGSGTGLWSWYLRRAGAWLPASPKVDGVHPTTTDVT